MKLISASVIIILISFLRPIFPQQFRVGVYGDIITNFSETDVKYNFTQSGDIDKSNERIYKNDFGNFNSFGVSATTILFNNFLSGLEISYGEKNTWDITLVDNYYTKTNVSLLTLSVPLLYIYNFNNDYFLETGVIIGYTKSSYLEKYNIRDSSTGALEDKSVSKDENAIQFKPQLRFGTKLFYPFEPELSLSYALTSKFKYEDFRLNYLGSIEYNFNYLSVGLTLNYVLNF